MAAGVDGHGMPILVTAAYCDTLLSAVIRGLPELDQACMHGNDIVVVDGALVDETTQCVRALIGVPLGPYWTLAVTVGSTYSVLRLLCASPAPNRLHPRPSCSESEHRCCSC